MLKEEIFENRRAVAKKICQDIRANGGRMAKAKYFSERPYCAGTKPYKFSGANYLRLPLLDAIDAVKKYAESHGANELTSNLTVQTWLSETGLETKMISFLPTYSETILAEIEKSPDIIFESMSKAQAILKNFRREKIKRSVQNILQEKPFRDLKIIYHGSEEDLLNKNGFTYPKESILTGISAYDFLLDIKSVQEQKIWLEFSYKDYSHGKFLISGDDFAFDVEEFITPFLRARLDKNRQYLLDNPHELKKYLLTEKAMSAEEFLARITLESKFFQSVMDEFQHEELSYLGDSLES